MGADVITFGSKERFLWADRGFLTYQEAPYLYVYFVFPYIKNHRYGSHY